MSSANEVQVGGDHYKGILQHWDLIAIYNVDYFIASASAYFVRWRNKNGVEDLQKASHYLTKREQDYKHGLRDVPRLLVLAMAKSYSLTSEETSILVMMFEFPVQANIDLVEFIHKQKTHQPGTPEDGGHHARQGEE